MSEKFWFLKNSRLFESLDEIEIKRVESSARTKTIARGNPVYLPAETADGVLLLASGRIKICHLTPEGKQSILAFVEPGELFGELALLESETRDEYAEAVEKSIVLLIPKSMMESLMETHPTISLFITRLFGLRRKRIERRLKYLLFRSNRERLVHLLLELAEQYGRRTNDGISLGIKLSHQDMANVIGSTRETVTVLLGELQKMGFIQLARRQVTVCNLDAMAKSVSAKPPPIESRDTESDKIASFG